MSLLAYNLEDYALPTKDVVQAAPRANLQERTSRKVGQWILGVCGGFASRPSHRHPEDPLRFLR